MRTPKQVNSIELEATCSGVDINEWDRLMLNATRADKRRIDAIVKRELPDVYCDLSLRFGSPYDYYKTETHLILVHSAIEYFFAFN